MPILRRRRRAKDGSMSLVEHLDELRKRITIALLAVAVCSVVGFIFFDRILEFLVEPYCDALASLPAAARPVANVNPGAQCSLIYSGPTDPFLTFLKIGFFTGLMLALPVVLWQLWRFITPGLTKRERRLGIPFVIVSVLLFAGGAVFAYLIIPRGLAFLFSFGGDSLTPLLTADKYIGFLILLTLVFGISFEFPLVMIFLAAVRIVSSKQMRKIRRYAYFGIVVFAAVATPTQDPYTMGLMAVPLIVFYEGAILVARLFKR